MNPIQLSKTVKIIVLTNFILFCVQQLIDRFAGGHLFSLLALSNQGLFQEYKLWQLITYSFLHSDLMHLFFNLMMLAFIGSDLEFKWGRAKFIKFYLFCILIAALAYLFISRLFNASSLSSGSMVGASGGIYGLLMAYGLIYGERSMMFMMIFPMKAKHFVWLLALVEFMTTVFAGQNQLSSVAHLGGMLAGLVYLGFEMKYQRRQRLGNQTQIQAIKSKTKSASHLRVVKDDEDRDPPPKFWN